MARASRRARADERATPPDFVIAEILDPDADGDGASPATDRLVAEPGTATAGRLRRDGGHGYGAGPARRSATGPDRESHRPTVPRAAWVGIALIAVIAFAVGNHYAVQRIAGTAAPIWHAGPGVGACVNLDDEVAVVPCDGPHDGEITATISARDAASAAAPSAAPGADTLDCRRAMDDYLGTDAGSSTVAGDNDWTVPGPSADFDRIGAPRQDRTGPYGWSACVVRPAHPQRYLGSVRGGAAGDFPGAYRTCTDWGVPAFVGSGCGQPHHVELLGTTCVDAKELGDWGWTLADPPLTDDPTGDDAAGDESGDASGWCADASGGAIMVLPVWSPNDGQPPAAGDDDAGAGHDGAGHDGAGHDGAGHDAGDDDGSAAFGRLQQLITDRHDRLVSECRDLASRLLDTDDPTYGGRLMLQIGPANVSPYGATGPTAGPASAASLAVIAGPVACRVGTPDGKLLTNSLVGQGPTAPALIGG